MNEQPPIVILTALELEYKAVRDRLSGIREPPPEAGTRFEVGSLHGGEIVLAVAGDGTHGPVELAELAIRVFRPAALLFVGVSGGLRQSIRLGDVVVATQVYGVGGTWPGGRQVEQIARRIARRDVALGAGRPLVHFGPVASGEIRHDALAAEREAAGVAEAARLGDVPVGVIRAISDGDGWRERAARNAAAFAMAVAGDLVAELARRAPDLRARSRAGRHGVAAGAIGGASHAGNRRPGWSSGPGRDERGRR